MKKLLLLVSVSLSVSLVNAQLSVPKVNASDAASALSGFIKPPAIGDVKGTTKSITDMLTKQLSLPAAQTPKLTDAISGFLGQKKGILGLATSNPADYLKKFNPLQQGLFGKMKGIMGAAAFSKFLGMKPSGAGSVLSNLFF